MKYKKDNKIESGGTMKLQNGVTGFFNPAIDTLSYIDGKQFKQICFTVASKNKGKIVSFETPGLATNFYKACIELSEKKVFVLLNAHYPYLTFATNVEYGNIQFINEEKLAEEFSSYYTVLSKEELIEPIRIRLGSKKNIVLNENTLNEAELEQIVYWQPNTIGHVLFNYWD